jgi:hypothetical protein
MASDALRAFERPDRRLLVDGEHDGVLGRSHIEPDYFGGLGGESENIALRFTRCIRNGHLGK